jgi:trk system potassium uptake protein TrkH
MINWRSNYAFTLHREDNSRWSEAKLILGSFLIILLVGTLFLVQPSSHKGEVTVINALFTATSAISVTGLGVVDTGTAFTLQGQIILLILMEIGGLGQMTMTLLLIAMFSKRVGLRQQVLAKEALGQEGSVNIVQLVKRIVLFALIAQLIGTAIMAIRWVPDMGWGHGLYVSFFHAVSAFNNAGFSLFANNLMDYRDDPIISLTIPALLILGGRLHRHRRPGAQPPLAQAETAQQADAADDPCPAAAGDPDVLAAGAQQPGHPGQRLLREPVAGSPSSSRPPRARRASTRWISARWCRPPCCS